MGYYSLTALGREITALGNVLLVTVCTLLGCCAVQASPGALFLAITSLHRW